MTKQNDKIVYAERFCSVKKEYVTSDNKICNDFIITTSFWCKKEENWLDILVCINRQRKRYCKCKQGKEILKTARRRPDSTNNLSKKETPKNKLIKREVPKTQLKRKL